MPFSDLIRFRWGICFHETIEDVGAMVMLLPCYENHQVKSLIAVPAMIPLTPMVPMTPTIRGYMRELPGSHSKDDTL